MEIRERIKKLDQEILNSPEYIIRKIINDFNEEICIKLKEKKLKKKDLAKLIGSSPQYVSNLLNGNPNLTIKSLVNISMKLDMIPEIKFKFIKNEFKQECIDKGSDNFWDDILDRLWGVKKQNEEINVSAA